MSAPTFVDQLLAWRSLEQRTVARLGRPYAPNCADADNCEIADFLYVDQRVGHIQPASKKMGTPFEVQLLEDIRRAVAELDTQRTWVADRQRGISEFAQYSHMGILEERIKADLTLRTEFGREFAIEPDITIGVQTPTQLLLHAVISVKWSMRSDRVQNVRPEGALLSRHRRGRAPHFVVITAEPLPTRIASIAMTTGEVDAVYHVMFDEMTAAVEAAGTQEQKDRWHEMVTQGRVRDYNTLPEILTST